MQLTMENIDKETIEMMKRTAPEGVSVQEIRLTPLNAEGGGSIEAWITIGGVIGSVALNILSTWIYDVIKEVRAKYSPPKSESVRITGVPLNQITETGLREILQRRAEMDRQEHDREKTK
jgi:hypothetical protein